MPVTVPPRDIITMPVTFAPTSTSSSDPFAETDFGCAFGIGLPILDGEGLESTFHSASDSSDIATETIGLSGTGTAPDIDVVTKGL